MEEFIPPKLWGGVGFFIGLTAPLAGQSLAVFLGRGTSAGKEIQKENIHIGLTICSPLVLVALGVVMGIVVVPKLKPSQRAAVPAVALALVATLFTLCVSFLVHDLSRSQIHALEDEERRRRAVRSDEVREISTRAPRFLKPRVRRGSVGIDPEGNPVEDESPIVLVELAELGESLAESVRSSQKHTWKGDTPAVQKKSRRFSLTQCDRRSGSALFNSSLDEEELSEDEDEERPAMRTSSSLPPGVPPGFAETKLREVEERPAMHTSLPPGVPLGFAKRKLREVDDGDQVTPFKHADANGSRDSGGRLSRVSPAPPDSNPASSTAAWEKAETGLGSEGPEVLGVSPQKPPASTSSPRYAEDTSPNASSGSSRRSSFDRLMDRRPSS